jgi:hypothetical protein
MGGNGVGMLMRALGVTIPVGAVPGGFITDAAPVRLLHRGQTKLVMPNGDLFKMAKAA